MQRLAAMATLLTALVIIVVASAFGSDRADAPPDEVPTGGVGFPRVAQSDEDFLAAAGGWLWWSDASCHVTAMHLATLQMRSAESQHCRIWPNPRGTSALATIGPRSEQLSDRRLVVLEFEDLGRDDTRRLRPVATVDHQIGPLASPVAWNGSGGEAAFCVATLDGPAVIRVRSGEWAQRVIEDACEPAWSGRGDQMLTMTRDNQVIRDGRVLPLEGALRAAIGAREGGVKITALAARDDLIAVGITGRTPSNGSVPPIALVLVRDSGQPSVNVRPGDAEAFQEVGLARDGRAAWYLEPGQDISELGPGLGPRSYPDTMPEQARRYAWEPAGAYVAVALEDEVRIVNWRTGGTVTIGGISAHDLAWSR